MKNEILGLAFLFLAIVFGVGGCQLALGFYGLEELYNGKTVMTFIDGSSEMKAIFAAFSATLTAGTGLGMLLQPQT